MFQSVASCPWGLGPRHAPVRGLYDSTRRHFSVSAGLIREVFSLLIQSYSRDSLILGQAILPRILLMVRIVRCLEDTRSGVRYIDVLHVNREGCMADYGSKVIKLHLSTSHHKCALKRHPDSRQGGI